MVNENKESILDIINKAGVSKFADIKLVLKEYIDFSNQIKEREAEIKKEYDYLKKLSGQVEYVVSVSHIEKAFGDIIELN